MHEGQTIGGYRIDMMIGEGAAGWVYQAATTDAAEQTGADPVVAVKILKPNALAVPQVVASFQFESRVLLRLDDPHIMRAFEAGNDGDTIFLVTELVPGEPLNAVLGKARRFSAPRT